MGQVFIDFTIRNSVDLHQAWAGQISPSAVHVRSMENVVMDTGATLLCLPEDVVAQLGLIFDREVTVHTATGASRLRVFSDARIEYEDRAAVVEAVELPVGSAPLFGALPMEVLGIEPDLQNRRVRKLPMDTPGGFLRA